MDEKDWKKVSELFDKAEHAGLSLFAFVTVPVTQTDTGTATHAVDPLDETQATPAAHLVWAATPREARLMVCFPGGHFVNDITGAAIVTLESKDILDARNSEDIAMLENNLAAMLSQSALHD